MSNASQAQKSKATLIPLMSALIVVQALALGYSLYPNQVNEAGTVAAAAAEASNFQAGARGIEPLGNQDAGPEPTDPAPVGIILTEAPVIEPVRVKLKVHDYQFYRPDDRYRVVRPAPKKLERFPVKRFGQFGFGLILEGENTGQELLNEPVLSGHFIFHTATGPLACELTPVQNHLSLDTSHSRYLWVDESADEAERVWRPGETIRWVLYRECFETFAFEKGIEKVSLHLMVEMKVGPLDGKKVRSSPVEINLPGGVLSAQPIQRNDGVLAFLSGQNLIELHGRHFKKSTLFQEQKMVTDFTFKPLMGTTLPLRVDVDSGFNVDVDVARMVSWHQHPRARKGMRVVEMKAKLNLNTDEETQKVEQEIALAEEKTKSLYDEMVAAETQYALLKDQVSANRTLWPDVNEAKKNYQRKRWAYRRMATEAQRVRLRKKKEVERIRMRRAKMLPCDKFRLATDRGWVKPMDALDVRKRCQFLRVEDEVEVLLTYRINRYEVPIALGYQVGSEHRLHPLASKRWLRFDPR